MKQNLKEVIHNSNIFLCADHILMSIGPGNAFFFSGNDKNRSLNFLDYVEDSAKDNIVPMNVDQQEKNKAISCLWKTP